VVKMTDTNMYVGLFALVLLLFAFRRYVVMNHLCSVKEASQAMTMAGSIGRLALYMMIILAGLFYLMGYISIATELSVMAAIVVIVSAIVDWVGAVVPKGTVINPARDG